MAIKLGTVIALIQAMAPKVSPEVIEAAVSDWLDDHPEATTTVEDGSITEEKLAQDVAGILSNLQDDVTGVENAIHGVEESVECVPVQMAKNKYIDLSGDTISMSEGHPAYSQETTSYSCGYISCEDGDVFVVTGSGGNATRLWAFVDDEGTILFVSKANESENKRTLIAPENSAWFIVHTSDDSVSYKGDTLNLIKELYIYKKNEETVDSFEQGSINGTDGSIISSTTRIHTLDFTPFDDDIIVEVGSNIKWSSRFYSAGGSLNHADDVWTTKNGIIKKTRATDYSIRLNIAYKNDSTITPNDEIYVKIYNANKEITDKTLSKAGKIADAQATGEAIINLNAAVTAGSSMIGNASIRAAKTLNFADGTPPLIDWYLIQTVDSKFYRTKDFIKKEYLFTTRNSGMTGYVSDWSCAILPNNDVLFVADAAGLSTSVNGRLSDANRINPIIFLASENYEKAHIIDFGSSLKPCGWLNNVGFCTLPNGDMVFAEYTRGTVKTANVWKISGDATDPENWTVTWSVNIIDTMDTSTPGTKHCHEVMYDFFTGVLYFGTGDSASGSNNFYSTDNGDTWNALYGNDRNRCRRLNFIFTEDKVYWASDSYQEDSHHFFVAERDNNGIIDVENATEISLISGNGQACYGCVYLKSMNLIVMMDRIDVPVTKKLDWYCYDLETETVEKIGEIGSANNTLTALGFRCRFMDFYPVGNEIITGFSPRTTSANEDTNQNKLCGNQGGSSGDGSTRINNLLLYVYKNGTDYSYRAKTMWI